MRTVLLALLMLATATGAAAQVARFSLRAGVAAQTNDLADMRTWQRADRDRIGRTLSLDVQAVDVFPRRPAWSLHLGFPLGRHMNLGVAGSVTSTAGRLHYADYSGELFVNHLVTRTALGLFYEQAGRRAGPVRVVPGLAVRGSLTNVRREAGIRLTDGPEEKEKVSFQALSVSAEPRIGLELPLREALAIRLEAGYEYDFGSKLKSSGGPVGIEGGSSPLRVNWSGFRVGLSLGLEVGR